MPAARTALDLFHARVAAGRDRPALRFKQGGSWQSRTWGEWDARSRELAAGLRSLGIEVGDRVCILSNTRPEWVEADLGILLAGAATVPIYQSNTPRECEYIIADSGAKAIFVEDQAQLDKVAGKIAQIILISGDCSDPTVIGYDALRAAGRAWLAKNPQALEKAWETVTPDDVFTIVYTSGTTGPPKGVVLTHKNMVFECQSLEKCFPVGPEDEQLLFLPLAHIFAKILEWTSIHRGASMAFAEGVPQLVDNLRDIKPTFMGAVPRVYEKVYAKIQSGFAEKRKKAVTRGIVDYALAVGRRRSQVEQSGEQPKGLLKLESKLADKLVFGKIKAIFGGRIRFLISGGAPLSQEIAEFFHACGLLVLEGYWLTETTAATHINRLDRYRFGTVGPAIPGVEIKIAADGEVLARGDNILREYFGKPDATREAIDAEKWFHTGDIGVVEDGLLRITDRKKDIIVTAGGKNVAPQNIESALKAHCPYVSQAMVHGDKRKFLSALITLNEENIANWAKLKGIAFSTPSELAAKPEVKALVAECVDKLNQDLASYETIKKFAILPRDLTQEAGELTPTLKVKRKLVSEKYRDLLDGFYAQAAGGENP